MADSQSTDMRWLHDAIREIKIENGLNPDDPGMVCLKCRKIVCFDDNGDGRCDCFDERPAAAPARPA